MEVDHEQQDEPTGVVVKGVQLDDESRSMFSDVQSQHAGGNTVLDVSQSVTASEAVATAHQWCMYLERTHCYAHREAAISNFVHISRDAPLSLGWDGRDLCEMRPDDLPFGTQVIRAVLDTMMAHAAESTVTDTDLCLACMHCGRNASDTGHLMTRLVERSFGWAATSLTKCSIGGGGGDDDDGHAYASKQDDRGRWEGEAICLACLYKEVIHPKVADAAGAGREDSPWLCLTNWAMMRSRVNECVLNEGAACLSHLLGFCGLSFHRVVDDCRKARFVTAHNVASLEEEAARRFRPHVTDIPNLEQHMRDAAKVTSEVDYDGVDEDGETLVMLKAQYERAVDELEEKRRALDMEISRYKGHIEDAIARKKREHEALLTQNNAQETGASADTGPRRQPPKKRARQNEPKFVLSLFRSYVDEQMKSESKFGVPKERRLSPVRGADIDAVCQFIADLREILKMAMDSQGTARFVIPSIGERVGDTPTRCRVCHVLGHGTGNTKNSCPFAHGVFEHGLFDSARGKHGKSTDSGGGAAAAGADTERCVVSYYDKCLSRVMTHHRAAVVRELDNVEGLIAGWHVVVGRNERVESRFDVEHMLDHDTSMPTLDVLNVPLGDSAATGALMYGLQSVRSASGTQSTIEKFHERLVNAIKHEASKKYGSCADPDTDSAYRRVLVGCAANELRNWRQARASPNKHNCLIVLSASAPWSALIDAVSVDPLKPHQLLDMAGYTNPSELSGYSRSLYDSGFGMGAPNAMSRFLVHHKIGIASERKERSLEYIFGFAADVIEGVALHEYNMRSSRFKSIGPVEWIVRKWYASDNTNTERAIEVEKTNTEALLKKRDEMFDWFILLAVAACVQADRLSEDQINSTFKKYNITEYPRDLETAHTVAKQRICDITEEYHAAYADHRNCVKLNRL